LACVAHRNFRIGKNDKQHQNSDGQPGVHLTERCTKRTKLWERSWNPCNSSRGVFLLKGPWSSEVCGVRGRAELVIFRFLAATNSESDADRAAGYCPVRQSRGRLVRPVARHLGAGKRNGRGFPAVAAARSAKRYRRPNPGQAGSFEPTHLGLSDGMRERPAEALSRGRRGG
jgi:hypothetical protein